MVSEAWVGVNNSTSVSEAEALACVGEGGGRELVCRFIRRDEDKVAGESSTSVLHRPPVLDKLILKTEFRGGTDGGALLDFGEHSDLHSKAQRPILYT